MIFPELGPAYYEEKHRGILARMESSYAQSITINQSAWGEGDTDLRFYMGDQTLWNDVYGNLPAARKRQFNFNRIQRVVNMISGHQRRNRKSTICTPIENSDSVTADQFTKILMWNAQQEGILETISEAFQGALITGMNLLQVWMDYRSDPISGNIRVDNCSYNSFLIDPFFRKATDLSDCNFIWKRSFLTKRECVSLLPDQAEEIMGLFGNDSGTGRDGKFQFMPESYGYAYKDLLTYDEYYYRDYRSQRMLADSVTGETMEWRGKDEESLKMFLQLHPRVTVIEQDIPTVRLAIVVQGKVMYDGPQPMGIDSYPFVPVYAYYNPQSPYWPWRVQGVVRGLRDPQYLWNRRMSIELDILESQINSGWVYKEDALVNPLDIYTQAGQGKGLALKAEAQMTDVQKIVAPDIPPGMLEISKILAQEIQEISGVSEELLGSATDNQPGILSMLRQGAGLTTLQFLFDQLDASQKQLGKIMMDLIQVNFTPGKVKKILGGEEPSQEFYNKNFGRYNCVVEEGLNTSTQKQMQFAQMIELRQVGVPIPDDQLLEASTLQNKSRIIESIKQSQQAVQQAQQQAAQLEMEQVQANIEATRSTAYANVGLGNERESRIQENQALAVERRAEANKDNEMALLNFVKALKEIEDVDIAQLEKLISLSRLVSEKEAMQSSKSNSTVTPTTDIGSGS